MHAVASSIYVDRGDKAVAHSRERAIVLTDGAHEDRVRTIILPSDGGERVRFLDQLIEAADSLRRTAYRELAADSRSQYKPGEIAPND